MWSDYLFKTYIMAKRLDSEDLMIVDNALRAYSIEFKKRLKKFKRENPKQIIGVRENHIDLMSDNIRAHLGIKETFNLEEITDPVTKLFTI